MRRDYARMKDQYMDSLKRTKELESQLEAGKKARKTGADKFGTEQQLRMQLAQVNEQLLQKSHLLDKVKALLHTAAAREKQLFKEVSYEVVKPFVSKFVKCTSQYLDS